MRVADIVNFLPPDIPSPSVQLEIPPQLKAPRQVLERLSRFTRHVFLEGDMQGNLTIEAQQDTMNISSCFPSLRPRFEAMDEEQSQQNHCRLKCDSKRVASLLQCQSIPIDTSILCFVEGACLVLHVLLLPRGSGTLTYYLPSLFIDDLEREAREEEEEEEEKS